MKINEVITVDGSEIRANAPVEVGSSSLFIFVKVLYISGGAEFLPSTVLPPMCV